ncbi:ABC transporter ATP-binding protein [Neorhizobium galegae]|uniref:ABC sorbitol/mannitol transporter, ATPase subunit n=1 Tax=Neorhizobium galegae bv. orientalis str. HAMBI 540 TaxID=1028800 RepID=A0A068T3M5_NEOGA|nr:ABC transporter ATP-binding protein [Neorhizobium galegae]MCQ1853362.1 ABC transporter ATP-binding protein [Neorhizobium galegae]CDN52005.1 ABC sorbitol/mannitol transporter, ATPase subunit [Neorhizobium galegae bv. orientalis str. HAMBI 540]CDZ53132.1 ATP-binding transport protein SmoK [Neorhizobium galegae bv. orientalis]
MSVLEYRNIKKTFGAIDVIPDVSLHIPHGSFTVFVGPSGCGKSTLLRLTAGLEEITDGQLFIDGRDVTEERPTERGIAMVFQSYALYPHMDVEGNIGFALKMAGVPKAQIKSQVAAAAEVLQLTPLLKRKPAELSGGQRQRVAIGRAIVREPKVFLLDEPLSNLDAALRTQMRVELAQLHQRLGATMIYVTHDQVEAMTLADQIVVLNKGRIEQVGAPIDLYNAPKTLFVAGFIGSPKMNFFTGETAKTAGAHTLGVRPEHIEITREGGTWRGKVQFTERLGSDTFLHVPLEGAGTVIARAVGDVNYASGQEVGLTYRPEFVHLFDENGLRKQNRPDR